MVDTRGRQAGDIEVTEAMQNAGFSILKESGISEAYHEGDKLLLAEIYRAMFVLRPAGRDCSRASKND